MSVYRFGLELEGFFVETTRIDPSVPPETLPHDGFPGLLEVKSGVQDSFPLALADLSQKVQRLKEDCFKLDGFPDFERDSYRFTPDQLAQMRRRGSWKDQADVQNLYGKSQRDLRGLTMSSFQINVSSLKSPAHNITGHNGSLLYRTNDVYGLFDYARLVKVLDDAFHGEIKAAKRQPGVYAIKDGKRMEYRSLPSSIALQSFESLSTKFRAIMNKFDPETPY